MAIFKKKKVKTATSSVKKTTKKATKTVSPKPNLSPILAAQKALGLPETGQLDYTTETRLKKFQMVNGLAITGEADAETLKKLG